LRVPARRALREALEAAAVNALAILTVVFFLGPMVWLYLTSIKPDRQVFSLPPVLVPTPPSFKAFEDVLRGQGNVPSGVPASLRNSIVVSVSTAALSIGIGIPAAYAFARFHFFLRRGLMLFILFLRMTPAIILIIPVFQLFNSLGLIDKRMGLILLYSAFLTPFTVWLLYSVFRDLPLEIEEAGRVDGCRLPQLLRYLVLPLAAPGIAAAAILAFIMAWNEYLFALVLTRTSSSITMPVSITQMVTFERVVWLNIAAEGVLMTLPVFLMSLFVQRYIVRGLTIGALK
jgi:multiple sugar transport system permease protein